MSGWARLDLATWLYHGMQPVWQNSLPAMQAVLPRPSHQLVSHLTFPVLPTQGKVRSSCWTLLSKEQLNLFSAIIQQEMKSLPLFERTTESLKLEKTTKITKCNHQHIPTMPITQFTSVPPPHTSWTPPGRVTLPLPYLQVEKYNTGISGWES